MGIKNRFPVRWFSIFLLVLALVMIPFEPSILIEANEAVHLQ